MDRRKFLKSFALIPAALSAGCVATFNGKDTKFDPNPVPTEKKHFERSLIRKESPEYIISFESGEPKMVQINPYAEPSVYRLVYNKLTGRFDAKFI